MPALPLSVAEVLEIKTLHREICRDAKAMLDKAIRVGELLCKAKQNVKDGDWSDWVDSSSEFSLSTSRRYMLLFKNRSRLKAEGIFSITDAYLLLDEKSDTVHREQPPPSKSTTCESKTPQNTPPAQFKFDAPAARNGSEKPPIELDEIGIPIPEDGIPFWHRREEIQKLLTQISHIKCTVENAKNSDDPMFARVSNAVIAELERVYAHIMEAKPYAVCTTCMGRFTVQPKGCSFCGDKGLISKWQWETQSRKEVKEMRMKMAAKRACTTS